MDKEQMVRQLNPEWTTERSFVRAGSEWKTTDSAHRGTLVHCGRQV